MSFTPHFKALHVHCILILFKHLINYSLSHMYVHGSPDTILLLKRDIVFLLQWDKIAI